MSKRRIILYVMFFVFAVTALIILYRFRIKIARVVSPFLLAVILAYLLHPLVSWLENRKIRRMPGILMIYFIFSVLIVISGIYIVPEFVNSAKDLMRMLPDYIYGYQEFFSRFISGIQSSRWSEDIRNVVFREMQNAANSVQALISDTLKRSLSMVVGTFTFVVDFLLALIIAYYFLKDAEFFKGVVLSLVPGRWRSGITAMGREINSILSNFVQGQLLTALIVGVLEVIGLVAVGTRYPLVLGLVGGIANVIPYFGPFIGAVPAVAVALLQSPVKALLTAAVFIVVQQLDNSLISPKIIEGKLGMHPVTTILVILIGGEFFGIVGMLLSVPVAAILRVVFKRVVAKIV